MSKESEELIRKYMKELRRELRGLPRHRKRLFLEGVSTSVAGLLYLRGRGLRLGDVVTFGKPSRSRPG